MTNTKPPVSVRAKGLQSFTRLALSLTESPPLLWHFKLSEGHYIGTFSVYMSWKGDIPMFTHLPMGKDEPNAFLAYRCDVDREECLFTNNIDDARYVYAPIIDMKNPPKLFKDSIRGKWPALQKPMAVELDNAESLVRLLYLISSKEYTSFPVWHFQRKDKHVLGVCVPFEHYYESNALPVFFYIAEKKAPDGVFFRYATSKAAGETLEFAKSASDTKYFYAKIIDVDDMPLFPG